MSLAELRNSHAPRGLADSRLRQFQTFLSNAIESADKGNFDTAARMARAAVGECDTISGCVSLAQLFHLIGELTDARRLYMQILEKDPVNPLAHIGILDLSVRWADSRERDEMLLPGGKPDEDRDAFHRAIAREAWAWLANRNLFSQQRKEEQGAGPYVGAYIGGVGRSGTTMMVSLLDQHSVFAGFDETKLVDHPSFLHAPHQLYVAGDRCQWVEQFKQQMTHEFFSWDIGHNSLADGFLPEEATELRNTPHGQRQGNLRGLHRWFNRDEVDRALATLSGIERVKSLHEAHVRLGDMMTHLYQVYADRRGKRLWIEKTPGNSASCLFLFACTPRMKLINLIRDGRDVAVSVVKRPWGPATHCDAVDWWANQVTHSLILQSILPPNTVLNLRYEDLVESYPQTLACISEFLGIEVEPAVVNFPTSRTSLGSFRRAFSAEEMAYVADQYQPLFDLLGYEVS